MLQNISQMIYDAEFEIKASTNSLSSVDYIQSEKVVKYRQSSLQVSRIPPALEQPLTPL